MYEPVEASPELEGEAEPLPEMAAESELEAVLFHPREAQVQIPREKAAANTPLPQAKELIKETPTADITTAPRTPFDKIPKQPELSPPPIAADRAEPRIARIQPVLPPPSQPTTGSVAANALVHRQPEPQMPATAFAHNTTRAQASVPPIPPLNPPPRRPRFDPLPAAPRGAAPERNVQVTIGRVEIRAVAGDAPQAKTRDRSPVMSLDEYLKSRVRGAAR
jgi:hypothetical protein